MGILALSARTDAASRQRCFEYGADGYVAKPFSLTALAWRLKTAGAPDRSGAATGNLPSRCSEPAGAMRDPGREKELLAHLLRKVGARSSKTVHDAALRNLMSHDWPGNVRDWSRY